jgi:hypothetical protein
MPVFVLCCAAFVFGIYSRSLDFQFVLDDHRFTADPRIQDSGHLWDYFANYVWAQFTGGPPSFYRPVFIVWMRINFLLSGLSPWGWHLLSIAKHLLVAALLGFLVWRLLRNSGAALAAGLLFAIHPAQTESVSWVTVPDPLMAAGVLAALLFYSYWRFSGIGSSEGFFASKKSAQKSRRTFGQPSAWWLVASLAGYLAALLAKETAIVFPMVIFALEFFIEARPTQDVSKTDSRTFGVRTMQAVRASAPFVGLTFFYLLLRLNALQGKLGSATQHLPWSTVVLSWPGTFWFYVKAMYWPVRSYSFADPTLVEGFSVRGVLSPLAALTCIAALLATGIGFAWRKTRSEFGERKALGVKFALVAGVCLLILPLLPALNLNALNPGDFLHGRYTYLPLCGLMLLLAVEWVLADKFRTLLLCAAGGLAIAFAIFSYAQEAQWKDDATVFTVAHQLAPHNVPVAQSLAHTRVQAALQMDGKGQCNDAMPIFEEVTRDYPEDWYAWAGLGDCYVQLNDLPKAEESLHRAADLSHEGRVIQQWQELRTHMGLSNR